MGSKVSLLVKKARCKLDHILRILFFIAF